MAHVEPLYAQIGARIRELREAKGLAQNDLGMAVNPQVTRACIANIEAGKQRVLLHILLQIANTLGTPLDWLLGKSDSKSPDPLDVALLGQAYDQVCSDLATAQKRLDKIEAICSAR